MDGRLEIALHWVRRRQRALTRAMLALFCLAWLQAAALPCVMAHTAPVTASSSHDCPYCPPAGSSTAACDDQGACVYPHQVQVDSRAAAIMFVAIPVSVVPAFVGEAGHLMSPPASGLPEPVPRRPLSVRYCRYIE
jgi:hypothetical protein